MVTHIPLKPSYSYATGCPCSRQTHEVSAANVTSKQRCANLQKRHTENTVKPVRKQREVVVTGLTAKWSTALFLLSLAWNWKDKPTLNTLGLLDVVCLFVLTLFTSQMWWSYSEVYLNWMWRFSRHAKQTVKISSRMKSYLCLQWQIIGFSPFNSLVTRSLYALPGNIPPRSHDWSGTWTGTQKHAVILKYNEYLLINFW